MDGKQRRSKWLALLSILFLSTSLMSQQTISGIITSADDNLPLPGASVIVEGTTQGTSSDFDGNYTLEAAKGDVLVFSYIGMQSQLITIEDANTINVALLLDAAQLDEVVVVGYGTQKKSSLTGSVSTIKSEELTKAPTSNATNLLAGRAPGVITRQTSSAPGEDSANISIRGFDNPLVMVDGVQSSLGNLDPNDIESVTVLKDAAAAIYGVRAGEGVVLVTTKRGKTGKTAITLHTNTSFQQPTRLQSRLGAVDYLELGLSTTGINAQDAENFLERYRTGQPNTPDTDWYKAVFTNWTPLIQHNVSVTGGAEKIKYFASAGFQDHKSQFRSGDLNQKRYNGRLNLDAQLTDKLSTSFNMSFILQDLEQPGSSPTDMFNSLGTAQPIYRSQLPDADRAAYSGFLQRSPLAETQRKFNGFDDRETTTFTAQGELKYKLDGITEGLSTKVRFDYLRRNNHFEKFTKTFDVWEYDPDPQTNTLDTFPYIQQGIANARNSVTDTRREFTRMLTTFGLDYQRQFGDHGLSGLFLIESVKTNSSRSAIRGFDLLSPEVPFLVSADPSTIELVPNTDETLHNGANESSLLSYITRLNYDFKERYFFEATLRIDQSSLFALDNRTGYFPSFSAAWAISREPFMEKFSNLNLLKIRASYSQVGSNIGIDPFQFLSTFEIDNGIFLIDDGTGVIGTTGLANSDVTWFKNNSYNLGLEGKFWGGLFGFEADLFYRLTEGRFARPTENFPTTFGNTNILPLLNLNDSDDRGIEVLLTHKKRINDHLSYNVSANFTYTKSKWVRFQEDLPNDPEEAAILRQEGQRRNRFFGFESAGLFESQAEIEAHADQDENGNSTLFPGDIKYVDQNNDGVIDFKDNVEIGRGKSPNISYGLNLGITYDNFSVSALFQGAAQFNTYISGSAAAPFSNESIPYDFHKEYSFGHDPEDPTVNNNTNPNAQLPYITGVGLNQNSKKISDFWLKDNDYLRLKSLNVNYSLPKEVLENIGIAGIDIYASATNLITWDKLGIYSDSFDPETRSGTLEGATSSEVNAQNGRSYPITKTLTLGVKISL